MAAARLAVFPAVPWQRCQFHLQHNPQAYLPRLEMRSQLTDEIQSTFHSPDLASAQGRLKDRVAF
jgi:transposase-like protein